VTYIKRDACCTGADGCLPKRYSGKYIGALHKAMNPGRHDPRTPDTTLYIGGRLFPSLAGAQLVIFIHRGWPGCIIICVTVVIVDYMPLSCTASIDHSLSSSLVYHPNVSVSVSKLGKL
jgi:hypothetical protein